MARRRAVSCARTCGPATSIAGPAIIAETNATTVVEPGWQRDASPRSTTSCSTRVEPRAERARRSAPQVDPVHARGLQQPVHVDRRADGRCALQNTAYSVNIKERLDFSCALFDADGNLIANAPHMPVHLGSMGESDQDGDPRERAARMQPGDVYVLNEPYNGGTHLPDITVITPVFDDDGASSPASTSASRGHHADIGGITPGSMPPTARRTIDEEGVLIDNFMLVERRPLARGARLRALLASRRLPGAQPDAEHRRPAGADRRQREGRRRSCAQMVAQFGLDVGAAPTWATCRTTPRKRCAACIDALKDGAFDYAHGQRRA